MIVSITGCTGFIGSVLVQRLIEKGVQLRLLSRKKILPQENVESFVGDLTVPNVELNDFLDGADVLYNCAGEIQNQDLMNRLHVQGTQRLVDLAKGRIGRLIQLSSVGAYGSYRSGVVTENSKTKPSGIYELTKTKSDEIVQKSGLPYVILRPSNVFGQTMRNQSLIKLIEMLRKRLFFYLGEAGALVNYVHVQDVVEALLECGNNDRALGNTYILSQATEIEKMVSSFASGLGIRRKPLRFPESLIRKMSNVFSKVPGFPLTNSRIDALTGHCRYDSEKIMVELGFEFLSPIESQFYHFASDLEQ